MSRFVLGAGVAGLLLTLTAGAAAAGGLPETVEFTGTAALLPHAVEAVDVPAIRIADGASFGPTAGAMTGGAFAVPTPGVGTMVVIGLTGMAGRRRRRN